MKMRIPALILIIATVGVMASCLAPLPIVGGGVAGAGMDSTWARREVEEHLTYVHPSVRFTTRTSSVETTIRRERDALLGGLNEPITIRSRDFQTIGALAVSFSNERISIKKGGNIAFNEQIPRVFHYSGLQIASFTHDERSYYVMLTYSRSSTSKIWFGLFDEDGHKLLTTVMGRHDVNDVFFRDGALLVVGERKTSVIQIPAATTHFSDRKGEIPHLAKYAECWPRSG